MTFIIMVVKTTAPPPHMLYERMEIILSSRFFSNHQLEQYLIQNLLKLLLMFDQHMAEDTSLESFHYINGTLPINTYIHPYIHPSINQTLISIE